MMTDSRFSSDDSDDGNSNIFTYQDQTQSFRVKVPNISNFDVSKLPIGQAHNGRPRYAESLYDQRSSYRERRDTSPISTVHSTSSLQHHFQHSMYRSAIGSQHLMYNPRFGSSMSVRSFDSNATLSAVDIAQALKNETFNKHDMRIIKDAVDKYLKKRFRNRIEKKRRKRFRNIRSRRRSGYDSGEQGSASSVSSDDAMSVRTTRTAFPDYSSSSCKSSKTDYTHFRRTMKESDMYKDCTDNFRQNAFKSLMSSAPKYVTENINHHKPNAINQRPHNFPAMNQKDRFRNGFLLPSQRFNQSIASSSIPEIPHKKHINEYGSNEKNKMKNPTRNNQHNQHSASENEEIFSASTIVEKNTSRTNDYLSKRSFNHGDDDSNCLPKKKRNKLTSPQKSIGTNKRPQKQNGQKTIEKKTCDFVFAKPQLPLRKPICISKTLKPIQPNEKLKLNVESSELSKKSVSESAPVFSKKQPVNAVDKLISKSNPAPQILISEPQPAEELIAMSSQPLDDLMGPKQTQKNSSNNLSQEKDHADQSDITQFSTTDMSMRPSFIKRKLFSQKADIAENKNASSDTIEENSPQSNMYSMIQKEKNRTRKLVTSQSCMNRDLGDESNLLELIHKIVPAEQMNLTSATNRTDIRNKSKPENSTANKWDVTLAITNLNKDEESDTYTDEEIFKTNETVIKPITTTTKNVETVKENHPKQLANKSRPSPTKKPKANSPEENPGAQKTIPLKNRVKSFWDSDEESDTGNQSVSEKTIIDTASNKDLNQVSKMQENNAAKSVACKNVCDMKQQKVESRTITKLASSYSKQKRILENKPVSKPSQTKQDTNSKGTASNNKNLNKVSIILEDINATRVPCNIADVQKNTKAKNVETKTVAKSASSHSKQNKNSEDKTVSKTSPRQEKTTVKRKVANIKASVIEQTKTVDDKAVTKSISVPNKQSINTRAKQKVTKDLPSKDNVPKLANKKATNSNQHIDKQKNIYEKVINKSLRIRKCRTPKINRCCDMPPNNVLANDVIQPLTKSLRTRVIDLSTTISSGLDTPLKDIPKRKKRSRKNKLITEVENKENVSNLSDLSFTLTMDKTIATRRTKSKINGGLSDTRKRPSDISFSLVNDVKNLNNTDMTTRNLNNTGMTTRSSERSRTESKTNNEVTKQKRMPIKSTNRSHFFVK